MSLVNRKPTAEAERGVPVRQRLRRRDGRQRRARGRRSPRSRKSTSRSAKRLAYVGDSGLFMLRSDSEWPRAFRRCGDSACDVACELTGEGTPGGIVVRERKATRSSPSESNEQRFHSWIVKCRKSIRSLSDHPSSAKRAGDRDCWKEAKRLDVAKKFDAAFAGDVPVSKSLERARSIRAPTSSPPALSLLRGVVLVDGLEE
eukprot:scaffold1541_cov256-Pinguiococcus_pyrenoidosus.AAC.37